MRTALLVFVLYVTVFLAVVSDPLADFMTTLSLVGLLLTAQALKSPEGRHRA